MEASPAAISPGPTRAQEEDGFSRMCEEMKTWLSGSPAVKCVKSADEGTKMKSSKSATAVSSKARSSILMPKAASDAHAESERTTSEDVRKLEAVTILSNGPSNPPVEIQEVMSQLDTRGLTAQDGCGTLVGEQPENIKSIESSKSIPRASTLLSDTPLPAPLHIIQAATAELSAVKPREDVQSGHSWSVSNVCPTEGGHEDGSSSLSFVVEQEADSNIPHPSSVLKVQEKIAHQHTGRFLDYATAEGSQCLLGAWLTKFPALPSVKVPNEDLCNESFVQCAIDTENGEFLPRIPQPETVRHMVGGPCEGYNDIGWRQLNMTSALYIKREMESRENALRMIPEQLDHKPEPLAGTEEVQWPKAKCVIRPAAPSDFAQIAEIINAEAANTANAQIFQEKLAMADDVCKIFDACIANSRPFIVAIPAQDDFLDQSKWPKDSDEVYQEFAKYMAAKPKPPAPVAGFAFVSDYRMNLYGAPCHASRYTGQVRLAVHPDHQRKLYGSALMDRILLSISPFCRSTLDYVWKCDDPKDVYQFPLTRNRRQYTQLYFEHFFAQEDKAPYQPGAEFLAKFGFQEVGYFKNAAVRLDDQHHSHWLNMVLWQSDITPPSKIVAEPQLSGSVQGDN
ncbi:hypothetical protein J3459_007669 [Metarhizium acridum]|nr:hypothetical protein J3459_007669 [Metarhizium acridum]